MTVATATQRCKQIIPDPRKTSAQTVAARPGPRYGRCVEREGGFDAGVVPQRAHHLFQAGPPLPAREGAAVQEPLRRAVALREPEPGIPEAQSQRRGADAGA